MNQLNNYYDNLRQEMLDFLPDSYTKVLEIGCGKGRFSDNLNSYSEYWRAEQNEIIGNHIIEHLDDYNLFFKILKKK